MLAIIGIVILMSAVTFALRSRHFCADGTGSANLDWDSLTDEIILHAINDERN